MYQGTQNNIEDLFLAKMFFKMLVLVYLHW